MNNSDVIQEDYNLFTNNGTLAFYKSAELINIFLTKESEIPINIFSLVIFEEKEINEKYQPFEHITERLIPIDHRSLGITKKRIDLKDAKNLFNDLIGNKSIWKIHKASELKIDELKILSKQFVPGFNEVNNIPLNSVLKNNEDNGSYILEFFSEEKNILNSDADRLNKENLNKLCSKIMEHLPIDLLFAKDRISNVIFQFPITLLAVDTRILDDFKGIQLKTEYHPLLKKKPNLEFSMYTIHDKTIIGSITTHILNGDIITGDVRGENKEIIKNRDNNLISWFSDAIYVERISTNAEIHVSEPRILNINGKYHQIDLSSLEQMKIGNFDNDYKSIIRNRLYRESTKDLIKNKHFLQYGSQGNNERDNALNDLRSIIKNNCENGVYIWDPYLDSLDILNTAYFCKYYNKEIKIITSCTNDILKKRKRFESNSNNKNSNRFKSFEKFLKNLFHKKHAKNNLYNSWKMEQTSIINSASKYGINLEIRCQRKNFGWKFHDRFLIFPTETPKVWSLGSSINSLGKAHSILMLVNNPQNILDAFNELWSDLEGSVFYKYPE